MLFSMITEPRAAAAAVTSCTETPSRLRLVTDGRLTVPHRALRFGKEHPAHLWPVITAVSLPLRRPSTSQPARRYHRRRRH